MPIELFSVPLYVLAGLVLAAFVAGWVDAVVGGGGLIQLPSLLIGLPEQTPTPFILGTNKLSSVAGTLTATLTYARKVAVDLRTAIPIIAFAFGGSATGSSLARFIPKEWLTPIVLAALIGVGIYTLRKPALGLVHEQRHTGLAHYARAIAIGAVVGFYDGILGPGTGSFFVIGMVALLGYGFLQASLQAKLANLATNVASIIVFGIHGEVLWLLGGAMAVANLSGGYLGAKMAIRHGNGFVRRVFLIVIVALVIKLGIDTVRQFS